MASVPIPGRTTDNMKDIGTMASNMEKVFIAKQIALREEVNGRMVSGLLGWTKAKTTTGNNFNK